jgi:hypothetical protein
MSYYARVQLLNRPDIEIIGETLGYVIKKVVEIARGRSYEYRGHFILRIKDDDEKTRLQR